MLACEGPEESFRKYLAACVKIYAGRSNLMHGALSPLDRRVPKLCADAEHVSRRALLRFLMLARAAPAQGNADEECVQEHHELYQLSCLALLGYSITIPGQAVEKSLGQLALCARACGGLQDLNGDLPVRRIVASNHAVPVRLDLGIFRFPAP